MIGFPVTKFRDFYGFRRGFSLKGRGRFVGSDRKFVKISH